MSFKKKKATKTNCEVVLIKHGNLNYEFWQYDDCVMFEHDRIGIRTTMGIDRKDANKLARWILAGKRSPS